DCEAEVFQDSNDDTTVAQIWLEDKQPEEKTNTDCLVKEQEKVHLGIKVGANITVTGVPGQEGAEGNVAEKKKVNESMEANLGKLLKYNAWSTRWSPIRGIVPVVIIDHQLPFEYTITSRSTDVVVMALPVQNINHSAFRSMFEREKLPGNNFIDWFCQLKLVLRVEKKMYFIEQPLPAVPIADSEAQDLIVGLILNGLTKDFAGFVRNYNMHNMGKTIGKLHAMLIEYEKGIPKKAETPQVMMIKGGKIQKANKKSLKSKSKGKANGKGKDKQVYIPKPKTPKPSAKEHPTKDDTCHHCKEVGL
ncbi:hypothetical protein Tco_0966177, partial [Tanacetum coccineum]